MNSTYDFLGKVTKQMLKVGEKKARMIQGENCKYEEWNPFPQIKTSQLLVNYN